MSSSSLVILGIDPGTRHCGYGVISVQTPRMEYVECGVIELPASLALPKRLGELDTALGEVIDELGPQVMAVEDVFHGIDARAALTLGHARGVVLSLAGRRDLEVHPYAPATVKRSVTGSGRAPKSQVAQVVRSLLGLRTTPSADAADALAVAICHAHHLSLLRLKAAARIGRTRGLR